jgi:hypothetical protein
MSLSALLLGLLPVASPALAPPPSGTVAIRVGRAETVSQGTIPNAVILVEAGKVTAVGEDLPVGRGIPVLDRPDWVAIPGLVNCWSRLGLDSSGQSNAFSPERLASTELYPRADEWEEQLQAGLTTIGLLPPGTGIPGRASVVRPLGDTPEAMLVEDGVFVPITMRSDPGSKKLLRDAFERLDKFLEKEEKNREKWEEKQGKSKKSAKKKSSKDDDKKSSSKSKKGDYEPLVPDPQVQQVQALRDGDLRAVFDIQRASDWLHLVDALGDEEIDFDLRVRLRDGVDIWNVERAIGDRELRVIVEPLITVRANTRRELNLPRELSEAGARIVFVPRSASTNSYRPSIETVERWLVHVGEVVAAGLDEQTALRAMTLEPAAVLGLEERLGSIEVDRDANLVFFDGDPFQPGTELQAVMLEGAFVHGEVDL